MAKVFVYIQEFGQKHKHIVSRTRSRRNSVAVPAVDLPRSDDDNGDDDDASSEMEIDAPIV